MKHIMYTKQFFQTFVKIWETSSADEMAQKLDISRAKVNYIASKIRKAGYHLTAKRQAGVFQSLLVESLDEIGFPKKGTRRIYVK